MVWETQAFSHFLANALDRTWFLPHPDLAESAKAEETAGKQKAGCLLLFPIR